VIWNALKPEVRSKLIWSIWFVTWIGLLIGFFERVYYHYVVLFSVGHLILFLFLFQFRLREFPIQLRIFYLAWVAIGTYFPPMVFLMYIKKTIAKQQT